LLLWYCCCVVDVVDVDVVDVGVVDIDIDVVAVGYLLMLCCVLLL